MQYYSSKFFIMYFVQFSAPGKVCSNLTTFGSHSPNLSVPEIVTFDLLFFCKSLILLQITILSFKN